MLRETSGTGDTYELLASSLLVVIALSLFLASTGVGLSRHRDVLESQRMEARAESFCSLIASSPLLASGSPGAMSMENIVELDAVALRGLYDSAELGFNYNITIEDVGAYEYRMETVVRGDSPPNNRDAYSSFLPIVIENGLWERRPGRLTVTIWEGAG